MIEAMIAIYFAMSSAEQERASILICAAPPPRHIELDFRGQGIKTVFTDHSVSDSFGSVVELYDKDGVFLFGYDYKTNVILKKSVKK